MTFAIDAIGLEKIYKGNVAALAGVDLEVMAGDIFALLGPNGAGKTTLMRILTTQFKPTSGEAHIFGLDIVRGKVRVVFSWSESAIKMSNWTIRSATVSTGYDDRCVPSIRLSTKRFKRSSDIFTTSSLSERTP